MKKNLLLLLGVAVMFFSCQKDNVAEETSSEALVEEQDLSTITALDPELIINEESEILRVREVSNNNLSIGVASKSKVEDNEADLEGFAASLPETVTVTTKDDICSDTGGSFIALDIEEGDLASTDNSAWCVDLQASIGLSTYDFDVHSSYEDLSGLEKAPGIPLFENANDFDRINWLLNQTFIGEESPQGGRYTFGHIQWAIWQIIEGEGNNCTDDCDFLSCDPIDQWDNNKSDNERLGLELVAAAAANGEGFVPQAGQRIAVVLASTTVQSLITTREAPAKPETCEDCTGDVDELTIKFNWHNPTRIKFYQRYENTRWACKIFDKVLQPGEEFTLTGVNHDGTFGKYLYIFTKHCYYSCFNTNCYVNIGPGFKTGVFEIVSGTSTEGGELCEFH